MQSEFSGFDAPGYGKLPREPQSRACGRSGSGGAVLKMPSGARQLSSSRSAFSFHIRRIEASVTQPEIDARRSEGLVRLTGWAHNREGRHDAEPPLHASCPSRDAAIDERRDRHVLRASLPGTAAISMGHAHSYSIP